jgi:UDP-N-acetylmuramoyl-tripeptide--D-alanyl-D-alanine ligase
MSEPLWIFNEALEATSGKAEGDVKPDLGSVSIDTRTLEPGALFVAIRGDSLDGHDYVAKAFEAGAGAALVADDVNLESGGTLIRVPDPLVAMNQLGAAARSRSKARIIAVTGSVGKTGTKEALRMALGASGAVHASEKSYNNHWGVPLTLANFARENNFGVFEVGMNHPGEVVPLTKLIRPHIAIITMVASVHLEFFTSEEQIAEAKAEIFAGLEPGATAILNRDNSHFELLKKRALEAGTERIIAFGAHDEADAKLTSLITAGNGSDVEAVICGEVVSYRVGAPGRHQVMNSLAVLAAVHAAGGDVQAGAHALGAMHAQAGRGARTQFSLGAGDLLLIDESYNANPASMRAALETLGDIPKVEFPRRIAVLGDMLEMGETSSKLHGDLAQPVDESGVDVVFACGPHMRALYEALPESRRGAYADSSKGLETALLETVQAGDVVMVKGSLGSAMGPLVKALRAHLIDMGGQQE